MGGWLLGCLVPTPILFHLNKGERFRSLCTQREYLIACGWVDGWFDSWLV